MRRGIPSTAPATGPGPISAPRDVRPSEREMDAARQAHHDRERLFRAEALASPDPLLHPVQIFKWVALTFGVDPAPVTFYRYPADAAPGVRGFTWKGSRSVYLADNASLSTVIHEAVHVCRPGLCEYSTRLWTDRLTAQATELRGRPVDSEALQLHGLPDPTPDHRPDDGVDWVR